MSLEQFTYPDGSRYEGEVESGRRHGRGTWIRPDGTQYVGQWQNDKPDGWGTITWPDGRKYEGQWKNGKRHGEGVDTHADGRRIEGRWEYGEFKLEKPVTAEQEKLFPELDDPAEVPKPQVSPKPYREPEQERLGAPYREEQPDLQSAGKGFFASLFDIKMKEMITPKIIRIFFLIGIIGIGLAMIGAIVSSLFTVATVGAVTMIATIIAAPIGALVAVIMLRVYLELIILLFNIYDQLKEMNRSRNR